MYCTREKSKAPVVKLNENILKIVHALAFVISYADSKGVKPSQYDLVKTLFLADRYHLNQWGRLITFDNYVAMKHGPVPSLAFNLLKEDRNALKRANLKELPWSREDYRGQRSKYFRYFDAHDIEFDRFLSDSDMDALKENFIVVKSLNFGQIRKLTHEDAAYVDAWEDESSRRQFPMSLGMLFDIPNYEKANELAEISSFA